MTLSDLASLGSFISGIGVLVSLVYLGLQIRQNNEALPASIQQGRVARIVDANLRRADPALAAIFLKGSKGEQALNELEFFQFMSIQQARFVNAEESFLQHQSGMLDEISYHTYVLAHRGFMAAPGNRAIWRLVSSQYDPKFAAFMDGMAQEAARGHSAGLFAQWAAVLAAEKTPPA